MPSVVEPFAFTEAHTLVPRANASPTESKVVETTTGKAFFEGFVQGVQFKPWTISPPMAFETTGDVTITVKFVSDQPAATTLKAAQFPTVGGWFGGQDRYAVYFGATDAPDSIEAGKVYTVKMTAALPKTGLFFRPGEPVGVYTYLGYEPAPGGTISYVVGGVDPAGIAFPHAHFNLSAPVATVILSKEGTLGPNPGVSAEQNPQPVDLSFTVPPEAVYIVAEVTGAGTGAGNYDVDLKLKAGGVTLSEGTGPTAREVVVLGPTALAGSRTLVAHIASAGATGGSYKLVVTAYGPA